MTPSREYRLGVAEIYGKSGRKLQSITHSTIVQLRATERGRLEPLDIVTVQMPVRLTDRTGFVYFVERGGLVKIGHTRDLRRRLATLRSSGIHAGIADAGVSLLGVEPGTVALEGARHAQFAAARQVGEWFIPTAELRAHIRSLWPEPSDVEHCVFAWNHLKDWFNGLENIFSLPGFAEQAAGSGLTFVTPIDVGRVLQVSGLAIDDVEIEQAAEDSGYEPRDLFQEVIDSVPGDRDVWLRMMAAIREALCASVPAQDSSTAVLQ